MWREKEEKGEDGDVQNQRRVRERECVCSGIGRKKGGRESVCSGIGEGERREKEEH